MKINQLCRTVLLASLALVWTIGASVTAEAQQEGYTFSAAALGVIGGSLDADPGGSLSNSGFQLNFSMVTEPGTHVGLRYGELNLDADEFFGPLKRAKMNYLTVGGEYRYPHTFYISGLYLGIGAYELDGLTAASGAKASQTTFGLTLGVTGEFEITPHFGVIVDIAGHWANFDNQQLFVTGAGGLVVHF